MGTDLQVLIEEILQEHPEWKDKQDELQTLLLEYSTLKPDVGWDEEYKATLKKKLLLLFRQQTMTQQMRTQHGLGRWQAGLVGAGITAAVACMAFVRYGQSTLEDTQVAALPKAMPPVEDLASTGPEEKLAFATSIEKVGPREFGKLATNSYMGQGGGGGGGVYMDAEMASQPAVDAEVQPAPDEKMIAYPYPENQILVYKYDFAGELPELPSELPVYQFKNTTTALPWKSGIFDVDSINLGAFSNLGIQNISLAEDKKNGFVLNLDLLSNTISMYKNYVYDTYQEILPGVATVNTGAVLATTQKFLDRYGIATSDYGNPQVVVPQYYPYMMEDVARETYPAPQITMVEVKYPFVLDDYTVYEQYGQMYGIGISYDLTKNEVQSVYNITQHDLRASAYPLIADTDLIKTAIQNGGMPAQEYGSEFDIKEISIPVSGPELIYTHLYIYHDGDQMPDRYFVPALKFQVHWDQVDKETTKDTYFRPGQPEMIVPLIEDAYLQ